MSRFDRIKLFLTAKKGTIFIQKYCFRTDRFVETRIGTLPVDQRLVLVLQEVLNVTLTKICNDANDELDSEKRALLPISWCAVMKSFILTLVHCLIL